MSLRPVLLPHTRTSFRKYYCKFVSSFNTLTSCASSTDAGNRGFDDPARHPSAQRNNYYAPDAPSRDPSPSGRSVVMSRLK
jgi:hypothetical protein